MPTQITQIDDESRGITIFRVDGDMLREDAELLGRIACDKQSASGNSITIDLADLDFLDSESAPVLCGSNANTASTSSVPKFFFRQSSMPQNAVDPT